MTEETISEYLARIGRKGGSVKGKRNALKYHTEAERLTARKTSQDAYRERLGRKAKSSNFESEKQTLTGDNRIMNKNYTIRTRRVTPTHYQLILAHVQSGKCLKVLADAVRDTKMTATDYENYIEGMYQAFVNPIAFEKLFHSDNLVVIDDDGQYF